MFVYLVEHAREINPDETDVKTIGIYSSEEKAKEAIARISKLVGFRDHIEGFTADKYQIDEDHWEEGFHTAYTPA
ncbi:MULTISPECIES: DUF7336 domain-containing protein [Sphingobium]|jgi:hypothetical protein|uniref:DUF7336 domain-containing protein n=1 Tax=Sphingobium limneticum TaxID=1007511 RepID=A0A5J5I1F4_9SPHN|nr:MULTISPECIES: hypothetical protein [Sphingobium]KAA9014275.1 hypothetical protein F4U96_16580 [Sphingobium limneticum]KAA9018566.1 hypothetical protein F4U94_05925 [Sphingobium limneticum]KAA9027364.1 hypothetical protein F4U95_16705 [Sphingobium limneticum]MBU0933731.1 hypothetical protein [Alphaproteobacteria bacterium]